MKKLILIIALAILPGCVSYAGITSASDGTLWIVQNQAGPFGENGHSLSHCAYGTQTRTVECHAVNVNGLN